MPHSVYTDLNWRMNGRLPRYLVVRRERGATFDDIAIEIRNSYGVRVAGETVRQWCLRLDLAAKTV